MTQPVHFSKIAEKVEEHSAIKRSLASIMDCKARQQREHHSVSSEMRLRCGMTELEVENLNKDEVWSVIELIEAFLENRKQKLKAELLSYNILLED